MWLRHDVPVGSEGRWWPEQLEPYESAVLGGTGDRGDPHPDVLVVGGGIVGVAVARALEAAGVGSVTLVERDALGSGATGGAAGLLTPEPHVGVDLDALVELGRKSLDGWRRLEAEVPGGVGLVELEWLGLLPDGDDASARSPHGELVGTEEVARIVPGLAAPARGLRIGGQARVNPLRALARLAAPLRHVATGVRVLGATVQRGRITAVATTHGRFSPGAVVFAMGTPPDVVGLAIAIPSDVVRGHILVTEPLALRFPGTVDPLGTPLGDGRLLVGGTLDHGAHDPRVDPAIVAGMVDELTAWTTALGPVRVDRAWCCFRPHHPDGLPTIDRVHGVDNAWFTSGHYRTGILMAPATAAVLTEWLCSGQAPPRAAPFSQDRLS